VGHALQSALATLGEVIALDRQGCDLADEASLRKAVRNAAPQVIVNAVAYTAVDKAEAEADLAHSINGQAPAVLGEEAAQLGALVIHYSTDYVFDGALDRPYAESDTPNPQSVYGRSKLAGEIALRASGVRHWIFRTSWVVGAHGGNFAKTILRLAKEKEALNVVADQWGAPTTADLIAEVTATAIRRYFDGKDSPALGLYHLAARGETNWHQYAQHVVYTALAHGIALKLRPDALHPIPTAGYPLPARRPANSRLNTEKLRTTFGIVLPDWKSALDPVLSSILKDLS